MTDRLDLDLLAPNYRRIADHWPEAETLQSHYKVLRDCCEDHQYGTVDYIKSFIECACITTIIEYSGEMPNRPNPSNLLTASLKALDYRNSQGVDPGFDEFLRGFNILAASINEMRNARGSIAHGKDGFVERINEDLTRAFLFTGDAVLALLLKAILGQDPDLKVTREPYANFQRFHREIDGKLQVDVTVDDSGGNQLIALKVGTNLVGDPFTLLIELSRLLYGVDRELYVEALKVSKSVVLDAEESIAAEEELEVTPALVTEGATISPVDIELESQYEGVLSSLKFLLADFLFAKSIHPTQTLDSGELLIDSILATLEDDLAVDWNQREIPLARMRSALRRLLKRFDLTSTEPDQLAHAIVEWLKLQPVALEAADKEAG